MKKWISSALLAYMAVGQAADLSQTIKPLTDLPAASGFEKAVRSHLQQDWQSHVQKMRVDGMGNLLAEHKGSQNGPKVLLMAHMDEVGLMVDTITKDGFIRVVPLGGIPSSVLFAQRWQIQTESGPVVAYSGMDSPHLLDENKKLTGLPSANAFFLDIGAADKNEAETKFHIRPGLQVTPASEMLRLSENRYLGKALDDRLGLAVINDVLAETANQKLPNQLDLAATVQEEIGLRGAAVVYASLQPDIAINIEVGIADDYPGLLAERKEHIQLGKGPTLFVYDRSMIPNQALLNWIMNLAKANHIPVQLEVESGYGEDASKLQASGEGVPAINLGIPMRYAHQQAGIFDARDYQQTVKLVRLIVENLNDKALASIKQG